MELCVRLRRRGGGEGGAGDPGPGAAAVALGTPLNYDDTAWARVRAAGRPPGRRERPPGSAPSGGAPRPHAGLRPRCPDRALSQAMTAEATADARGDRPLPFRCELGKRVLLVRASPAARGLRAEERAELSGAPVVPPGRRCSSSRRGRARAASGSRRASSMVRPARLSTAACGGRLGLTGGRAAGGAPPVLACSPPQSSLWRRSGGTRLMRRSTTRASGTGRGSAGCPSRGGSLRRRGGRARSNANEAAWRLPRRRSSGARRRVAGAGALLLGRGELRRRQREAAGSMRRQGSQGEAQEGRGGFRSALPRGPGRPLDEPRLARATRAAAADATDHTGVALIRSFMPGECLRVS